jgi:hypothetical protein
MRYYKRLHEETIQRFNKDWTAIDWYYFEVGEDNYATKQIQITYEGKVFKYDEINIEDANGGLAEGALNIEEYAAIEKDEFFELWNKLFTNTYLVKQLSFDEHWKMAWNNIDYNKTEQDLCYKNLIFCGTYKDTYLLDVEYLEHSNYLRYEIKEGSANIKYGTVDNWDELVSSVQLWIDYIQANADTICSKKLIEEKLERPIKVLVDEKLTDAVFCTYQNMDWDIEKFRGGYFSINEDNYANINTYIGMEDLLINLQDTLPKYIKMQSCLFCRYSHYNVAGNDNFGDLNCFKHCKEKCGSVKSKNDIIDLLDEEYTSSAKVEETYFCNDFAAIRKQDHEYKSVLKMMKIKLNDYDKR